ncbi:hypothetical protein JXA88_03445 [Candidatus Fermentibacteria bacterium]|nr:hypothetical protein [Candidatus Fermentibacteria bacterium]
MEQREGYLRVIVSSDDSSPFETLAHGAILGGEEFVQEMRGKLRGKAVDTEVSRMVAAVAVDEDDVARAVGAAYDCAAEHLRRRGRKRHEARDVAIYLSWRLSRHTNAQIGDRFGGIKAAAVSHACRRVSEAIRADTGLADRVRDLEAQLRPNIKD